MRLHPEDEHEGRPGPRAARAAEPAPAAQSGERRFHEALAVGSVAQSAIQAAIDARSKIKDLSRIEQIRVFAEEGAYDHLVKIRQDPWNPVSRETADHSLPYIVAAAVLDGTISVGSFTPKVVLDPKRQAFIRRSLARLRRSSARTPWASRSAWRWAICRASRSSSTTAKSCTAMRGRSRHHKNPFTDGDLNEKLRENVAPVAGAQRAARLTELLWSLDKVKSTRELTRLLAFSGKIDIDSAMVRER